MKMKVVVVVIVTHAIYQPEEGKATQNKKIKKIQIQIQMYTMTSIVTFPNSLFLPYD
jgi:hypothetical protein